MDLDVFQLLNLSGGDVESKIQSAIADTNEELDFLPIERTCVVYSNYLYNNLRKRHLVTRLVDTTDLGGDFMHHFVMVADDKKSYYVADLTYGQFGEDKVLKDLLENGYEKFNKDKWSYYMSRLGCTMGSSMDEAFNMDLEEKINVSKVRNF